MSFPEYVNGLPNICGQEDELRQVIAGRPATVYPTRTLDGLRSTFAIALHMHQPLVPAGWNGEVIGNLQLMYEGRGEGDNYNAPVFRECYKRIAGIVNDLVNGGSTPRVMLDYSGNLFHGLRAMGAHDVIEALQWVTHDHRLRDSVEWLGTAWGHAVAPSTPVQDFRLHVQAWQHHFAAIFGSEALSRVRGFSPSEMALPNDPDVAYEYVRTLVESGYQWVLVQEHTVELPDGSGLRERHLPHRLVCTNSRGETAEIIAIIKTQGSDNKLVAQMQPYYEAMSLNGWREIGGVAVPQLVTQIGDGENGGVMMNEFPPKYCDDIRRCSGSDVPAMNVTEYLEAIFARGVRVSDMTVIQPIRQHLLWQRITPSPANASKVPEVIAQLMREDNRNHFEGGSWTDSISWVRGYESVLNPMQRASAAFAEEMLAKGVSTSDPRYRNALFHLMSAETSCFRYWGQGTWTDFGAELARRASAACGR